MGATGRLHALLTRRVPPEALTGAGLVLLGAMASAGADDAAVLPAGVSRVYADYYSYLPVTERYNPDGERESLAHPFEAAAALDSGVFTSLAPLDALVGGTASIGNVSVAFDYDIDVVDLGFQHGLSDRLTLGIHVPWYRIRNDVTTSFDSSGANVGLHPVTGACCIPVGAGGVRFTAEDVQDLVTSQFGYARIESWRKEGFGDVEAGAKYRLREGDGWAFAASGGLRIPTGHADDPDDLTDVAWSFDNYALLFRAHLDYRLSDLWRGDTSGPSHESGARPGDVDVNATVRYDLMLPDRTTKRIGDTADRIFTVNRERVSRKQGDRVQMEIAAKVQATGALSLSALYRYAFKFEDDVSGTRGFRYESLETDTDSTEHIFVVRAAYSTIRAYRAKRFPVPLVASIAYRDRFAGQGPRSGQTSPVLHTRWVVAGLALYF